MSNDSRAGDDDAGHRYSSDAGHHGAHRQHDAHVHGIARLNLVLEVNELHMELLSPAANLVGFEHPPASAANQAALDNAVAALRDGDQLFRLNAAARCELQTVEIVSDLLKADSPVPAAPHVDVGKDHSHNDENHGHDGENYEHVASAHADIDARYQFACVKPQSLKSLDVVLFEVFPGTQELQVQFVINEHQGGETLTRADDVLRF
ncbi:DUF2796 domain-containing protein [Thiorhodovibrio litoralis]|uniref:DUF2796 domain-containing protein n=1 Tax=Thiorhodovibrio litoralis TaxID=2952932 RepID=UPI002B25DBBE|nr:DUF2796 domain-containing protein [Thiorhodovibrio litoralis]